MNTNAILLNVSSFKISKMRTVYVHKVSLKLYIKYSISIR